MNTMVILPVKRHGKWYEQVTAMEDIRAISLYNSVHSKEHRVLVLVTENKTAPYSYLLACTQGNITDTMVQGMDVLTCKHTSQGYDTFSGKVRCFNSPFYTWQVLVDVL